MNTREAAFVRLGELRKKYAQKSTSLCDVNEATTRLLVVDEILIILGWDKKDFHPETKVGLKSFTDYSLSINSATRLIVEAKRIGHTFASPKSVLRKTEYEYGYVQSAFGPALSEVLAQAKTYCEQTRVPFAVATNGAEWVIAQLIPPPGRTHADLRCYYVGNILQEDSHFDTMWELLCRDAVAQGGLEEAFDALNRVECEFSQTPRSVLGDWSALAAPTAQTVHLRDFYDRFFDEIVDPQRRAMLDHCYVSSARLEQYESAMKRALEDSAPRYVDDSQELDPGDTEKVLGTPSGDQKGRVVLIVGSVGAGKTTFVTKVMRSERDERLTFTLLNLINETDITVAALWEQLSHVVKTKHTNWHDYSFLRKVFHREIEVLKRGPNAALFKTFPDRLIEAEARLLEDSASNAPLYLTNLFRVLARDKKTNVVFIDNVDRLSEDAQRSIYSFAHKVSSETGASVIMSMRETTYYRAKEEGFLDVRSSDVVFHLQAPDLVQVVSKRVRYAEYQLTDPSGEDRDPRLRAWKQAESWESFQSTALAYAAELKHSLLQGTISHSAIELFAAVAWHNVRRFFRALRHVHQLLTQSRSDWTMESLTGALMIAEDGAATPFLVPTLFDPPAIRHLSHFLRLRLLTFLLTGVAQWEAKAGLSYMRILSFLRVYGYRKRWIDDAITSMVRERLLECLEVPVSQELIKNYTLSDSHTFRCSPVAVLLTRELHGRRVYLAASGWSLPFLDEQYYEEFMNQGNRVRADAKHEVYSLSELLAQSKLPEIVASYLHSTLGDERLSNESLRSQPDIQPVEEELLRIRKKWEEMVPELSDTLTEPEALPPTPSAQPLLPMLEIETPLEFLPLPKPGTFDNAKLASSSRLGAWILWALASARRNRRAIVSGAELAEIINRYGVGEHRAVLGTNVSRTLRSELMTTQSWLRCVEGGRTRRPRYSLSHGWENAWRETFNEEPPSLS